MAGTSTARSSDRAAGAGRASSCRRPARAKLGRRSRWRRTAPAGRLQLRGRRSRRPAPTPSPSSPDAKGSVELASDFRLSGYSSLVIRDVPATATSRSLSATSRCAAPAISTPTSRCCSPVWSEELNIALAGPNFFRLERDGIAFWLSLYDRSLVHYSDSMPKRLFEPRLFTWYLVDVDLDLEAGHLRPRASSRKEIPSRAWPSTSQPNAAAQPGSAGRQVLVHRRSGQRRLARSSTTSTTSCSASTTAVEAPSVRRARPPPAVRRLARRASESTSGKRPVCLPAIGLSDYVTERGGRSSRLKALFSRRRATAATLPSIAEPRRPLRGAAPGGRRP